MKTSFHKLLFLSISLIFLILSSGTIMAENETSVPAASPTTQSATRLPEFEGPLFLELILPKNRLYLGERIPVTIKLYLRDFEVNVVDEPFLTQPEFLFDKLRNPIQKHFLLDHQQYQIIEFSYLLTPVKTGLISLGPIKQNCYFTPPGASKRRMITTTTKRTIRVLPLPKTPAHFSGAIGNFQLAISVTPKRVLQGEPINVRLSLSGSGNLQSVSAPFLQNSTGFKTFNAQKKTTNTSPSSLWQQVTFEQVIIPVDVKANKIGPFSFTYFNPATGKYNQIRSSTIAINVKPNPNFKDTRSDEPQPLSEKIKPIKINTGSLQIKTLPLLQQTWFWLLQIIPFLLLIGSIIYRRNLESMESDSPKACAIRAAMKARQQLAAAQDLLHKGNQKNLLEVSILIFREYLGERFGLSPAGMTGAIIDDLRHKGLAPELLENIRSVFEQYDLHHFAGAELKPEEAAKLLELITDIIETLNKDKSSTTVNVKE